MIYEYEADDGTRMDRDCPMTEAPPIGHEIEVEGKTFRRMPPRLEAGFICPPSRHFVSHCLPYNYPYHKGEFDSQGRCLFDSWSEVHECEARANDHGENLKYD